MAEPATPPGPLERLDRGLYALEQGLITGALAVMTFTYFLQILHRELKAEVNAFDRLFLRLWGYEAPRDAPPETLRFILDVLTPASLTALAFLMALLALRTRWRVKPRDEPRTWATRLGLSALLVGLAWGLLALVEAVPARAMCLLVLAGLVGPALRTAARARAWGAVSGAGVGGVLVAWYFVAKVGDSYVWSTELASILLMYVGFFGASMATRDRRHISVDALRKKIPPRYLPLYNGVSGVVTTAFTALLLVLAVHYLLGQIDHGGTLAASGLPELVVSLPIALALAIMLARFAAQTWRDLGAFRRGEIPQPAGPELH